MERNTRKTFEGIVVANNSDKTCAILVETKKRHPLYNKQMKQSKKYQIHDEKNIAQIGDTIKVMETRPLSKSKR